MIQKTPSKIPGYNVQLAVVLFKEDSAFVVFCPALDLSAAGKTEAQARLNFSHAVEEYMRYTLNKGTLFKDLKKRGWIFRKNKKHAVAPPPMSDLLENNEEFTRIFDQFPYKKFDHKLELPAYA